MRDLPIVKVYKPTDLIRLLILSTWDPMQLQTTLKQKKKMVARSLQVELLEHSEGSQIL